MILGIDIGNTHIVIGCIEDDGDVVRTLQLKTDQDGTAHEYAVRLREALSIEDMDAASFTGGIICSVVPEITPVLAKAVRLIAGIDPLVLGSGIKTGLNIRLDDPGTIAGDMVATAVAAKALYPLPCIIVDMGTATAITVVDAKGNYVGGCIMPGSNLSLKALTAGASLLPAIDFEAPKKVIATNTADAMKSGILYGSAGAVDGVLSRFEEVLGVPCSIIATGGMGRFIAPCCTHEMTVDNRLLLKGLGIIYRKNVKDPQRKGAGSSAHPGTAHS